MPYLQQWKNLTETAISWQGLKRGLYSLSTFISE